jgi:Protein phosphatase 2C
VIGILPNLFWLSKDERAPDEWEDAGAFDMGNALFAVADGASQAYRAREWAMRLVERYVTAPPPPNADGDLALRWFAELASGWQDESDGSENTYWYQSNAERRGSFAAFVGIRLFLSDTGFAWQSMAVGDCCLFHVHGDMLTTAFPLSDPASFGQSPDLVPSAAQSVERLRNKVRVRSGEAVPGDLVLLCSDALAKFILEEAPRGKPVWTAIRSIADNDEFAQFIRYLRSENAIDIDDVTLLRLIVVDDGRRRSRGAGRSSR